MRVTDHLARATEPLISFEIIPPLRGGNVQTLMGLIEDLARHRPPFMDVTSHAAEVTYEEGEDGIRRKVRRKRPGTLGVCALIQNKYQIDAVPHVLCQGFTREETEDFLIELKFLGIDNVLAVRGDESGYEKPLQHGRSANRDAAELVRQIADMNQGRYLEADLLDAEPTAFCIGAAAYPEKHFEAPNLEADLRFTRHKVDQGADYLVTQMFFDNAKFAAFVEACRAAGIEAPILPGLKILTSKAQLRAIPRRFHCDIPVALSDEIEAAQDEDVLDVGVEWAAQQTRELMEMGAPAIHFYVMQSTQAVNRLMERLGGR